MYAPCRLIIAQICKKSKKLFIPIETFTKMTVSRSGLINWAFEVEKINNSLWSKVVASDFFGFTINDNGLLKRFRLVFVKVPLVFRPHA